VTYIFNGAIVAVDGIKNAFVTENITGVIPNPCKKFNNLLDAETKK